jgi:hypothetical protein
MTKNERIEAALRAVGLGRYIEDEGLMAIVETSGNAKFIQYMKDTFAPKLKSGCIKVFDKAFDSYELEAIAEFFNSPVGQKLLVTLPLLQAFKKELLQEAKREHLKHELFDRLMGL